MLGELMDRSRVGLFLEIAALRQQLCSTDLDFGRFAGLRWRNPLASVGSRAPSTTEPADQWRGWLDAATTRASVNPVGAERTRLVCSCEQASICPVRSVMSPRSSIARAPAELWAPVGRCERCASHESWSPGTTDAFRALTRLLTGRNSTTLPRFARCMMPRRTSSFRSLSAVILETPNSSMCPR